MSFPKVSTEGVPDIEGEHPCVFDEILAPIMPLIVEEAQKMPYDTNTYTLSFLPFTLNLLFGLISGIKSIGL